MNLKYTCILLLLLAVSIRQAGAQTNVGFVQQENIKVQGIITDAQIYPLSVTKKQTTRTYIDGLGRTVQNVGVQASPLQNDLIQPIAYDNLGRQTMSYLPYAGQSTDVIGSYRTNAVSTAQPAFYNQTGQYLIPVDAAPYAQQVFENSPLQRLLQAGTVGSGFQPGASGNYSKSVNYRPNSSSDGNILQWKPDGSYTSGTYYTANTLWVTDGKDEDNIETLSFADLEGHNILKRQILSSGNLDTYYIYDNAGMLIYIVPPKAVGLLSANSYNLTAAPLSNLVFKFVYDTMGRLVQKTVPAKGVIYIVYDPVNRPVLMQDANMRANNNWNYIKYDAKGRAISQGIYNDATHNTSLFTMQSYVSGISYATWYEQRSAAGTGTGYYTNNVFPTTGTTPLAYAYYDDYDLKQNGTPYTYASQGLTGEIGATTAAIKGAPTMVWKTTVGSGLSGTWLLNVIFYDKRGNAIQSQSNNQVYYTGSATITDIKTTVPDFIGAPQISKVSKQTAASTTTTVQTTFSYDHMYRLSTVSQAYNGGASSTVAAYNYNEIGQVIKKNLGLLSTGSIPATLNLNTAYSGTNTFIASSSITLSTGFSVPSGSTFSASIATNYLQTVDYRYNIRDQLLYINNSKLSNDGGVTNTDANDLFGMQFLYDQQDAGIVNTPSHDGKLTGVKWMSKDNYGNSSYERSYKYAYDGINRYTASNYAERATGSTGAFNNNVGGFDESGISYDSGGNILTLNRNASTQGTNSNVQIDNLNYTYSTTNPNQLYQVTDGTDANHTGAGFRNLTGSTGTYSYDVNGNLTADPYKGLTLGYDVLNRTDKITVTTGTNRWIDYTYDASGNLIRKRQFDNNVPQTTTDYVDGFVYINNTLSYFPMPEGRVLNNSGTLVQEFIITDQQGNARLSFQNNGSGTAVVKQENSYYAFGLVMPNSPVATPPTPNKQLYNGGSEWQNDYGNLPDYYQTFNRNFDAALGRFIGVDPVAESAESMTSYQYAGNNPVMYNDPLGDLLDLPGSHYAPYTPWHPLGYGGRPSDLGWQDSESNGGPPPNYDDGTGLYNSNSTAYWESYNYTDGTFGGTNIYHAGNGTGGDPHTGFSLSQLTNYLESGVGLGSFTSTSNGQLRYAYHTVEPDGTNGGNYVLHSGVIDAANQGGDKPLTHAQELAKYGYVTGGFNVAGTLSLGAGGTVEFGWVTTNKNYVQYYRTTYYTSTAAAGFSVNGFFVINRGNNKTTFSDWAGPIFGGSVNYGDYSGIYGISSTYHQAGAGIGAGLSFNLFGSGSVGWTTLIGSPVYSPPYDEPGTHVIK